MILQQTRTFNNTIKKLHNNQRLDLNVVIKKIIENPKISQSKKGDLSEVRVYKFRMLKQLTLLAYLCSEQKNTIILLALGTHENFYRELKRK